jgi:hypothetical protein
VVPTVQQWEAFWTAIDRIGVWSWEERYDTREVCDGVQWEIDIIYAGRRIRCFGSNKYPGGRNMEQGLPFEEFLMAVEALVGQPFG